MFYRSAPCFLLPLAGLFFLIGLGFGANAYAAGTNGACGTAAKTCSIGTVTGVNDDGYNTSWTCNGSGNGINTWCMAPDAVNSVTGVCGLTPETCSSGTVAGVSDDGYNTSWTCNGSGKGINTWCTVRDTVTSVNGACGTAAKTCSIGTVTGVNDDGYNTSWTCNGSGNGANTWCTVRDGVSSINGACGTSSGSSLSSAPTTNLCMTGTASGINGAGPWSWICAGANGGSNASCSASVANKTSPSGTTIPGVSQIVDASGSVWTVSGGVIYKNGALAGYSNAVTELVYLNGTVYQENSSRGWWSWNGSGWASANNPVGGTNGACGTSNGLNLSSAPTANLCTAGTASSINGAGPWLWSCAGANGGSNASCSANLQPAAVNGACGASNGSSLSVAPTTNLCTTGAASSISGVGPWSWSCAGANGGSSTNCSAMLVNKTSPDGTSITSTGQIVDSSGAVWTLSGGVIYKNGSLAGYSNGVIDLVYSKGVIYQENSAQGWWSWNGSGWVGSSNPIGGTNGVCGTSNGVSVSKAPVTNLCSTGTASSIGGNGQWTWSCAGTNGGINASCSAPLQPVAVNGACGASNGSSLGGAPATNLCTAGTASSISGTGPWSWSCAGTNGGSNASCSANLQAVAVNGICSSTAGMCSTGAAVSVLNTGVTTTWSCTGSNGGSTVSCSVPNAVNAACGTAANSCTEGTSSSLSDNGTKKTWICTGSYGGSNASCSIPDAVNGVCSPTAGQCSAGTIANLLDNGTTTTWSCTGSMGGTTASCDKLDNSANLTGSKLGVNIGYTNDWSDRAMMFVDVMKIARGFYAMGPYGQPTGPAVPVDANGWPTTDFGTIFISVGADPLNRPLSETYPSMVGTYSLSFNGKADVAGADCCQVQNLNYDSSTNTSTADVVVSPTDQFVALSFTNTNGGVQNIKLLRPGYPRGTTQVFTNQFLNAIAPFGTLRFMVPLSTNNNTVASWAERTLGTNPTQSGWTTGMSWEYIIQLANTSGKDIWINIPALADLTDPTPNNYVTQLAQLLKANLNPGIHVYVEYSNEVWNWGFSQADTNYCMATYEATGAWGTSANQGCPGYGNTPVLTEAVSSDPTLNYDNANSEWTYTSRRIAHQIVRISQLFANVYGAGAINTTIRPVYMSQYVNPYMIEDGLMYIRSNFGPPNQYIYGIGGAPYFGASSAAADESSAIAGLQSGMNSIISGFSTETYNGGVQWSNVTYKGLADYYGLKSLSYEGGPALSDATSNAINEQAENDPAMNQMIQTYLADWFGCGNDLFMYFDLAEAPGNIWGSFEDVTIGTQKYNALTTVAATPLANYNKCSNSVQ